MINKPHVVLDTNILISALVFGGNPRKIIELLAQDDIEVIFSEEIVTEARRIVHKKFPAFVADFELMSSLLHEDAVRVTLGSVTVQICRDPDDDRIIETALLGECGYIISGDKDLLHLKSYRDIRIVNAVEFLSILRQ